MPSPDTTFTKYEGGSKSFQPGTQKLRQMENAAREIYSAICGEVNVSVSVCVDIKGDCNEKWGHDSSVGIATHYGLEGPGIESRWGEIFRTYPDQFQGQPSLLYNGYRVFPGGKGGRGVMLITHPLLVPRLRKS